MSVLGVTFADPRYLLLLGLIPVAAGSVIWAVHRRRTALHRIGAPELVERLISDTNQAGRTIAQILVVVALGLAVLALARPQWGQTTQVFERQGVQLMVALDVSNSMLAEDFKPNRLERAKLEVLDIIAGLKGDEVGLVLFAGSSFMQFPLTFDYTAARTFLTGVGPDLIPRQGTVLEEAIDLSIDRLSDQRLSQKVILIISDGEDHEGDPVAAARRADEARILVYTIAIGSADGAPIPERDAVGRLLKYAQDNEGDRVITRVDREVLRRIALAGGGRLIRGDSRRSPADEFISELGGLQTTTSETEIHAQRIERFQLFAGGAIALLVASALIADRRGFRGPDTARVWRS